MLKHKAANWLGIGQKLREHERNDRCLQRRFERKQVSCFVTVDLAKTLKFKWKTDSKD
jgi:hypothetical protein